MSTLYDEVRRSAATLVGLCAIAAAGLTASCFSDRSTAASTVCEASPCVVNIRDFAFEPATLRVRAGATVRWVNQGPTSHTSTSDNAGWDSGFLAAGENYSRTFSSTGEFAYHCEPHPTMRATVIVE
jgi:plastocyanin